MFFKASKLINAASEKLVAKCLGNRGQTMTEYALIMSVIVSMSWLGYSNCGAVLRTLVAALCGEL